MSKPHNDDQISIVLTQTDTSPVKEAEQIYDRSVKTVDRSVYPERMYNKSLVHQTVHDVIANYNPDDGIVALPQDGLLPSEPFPWDSKKAVYVYHGHHSLHSVVCFLKSAT